jgi:hypothetical protein
LYLSEHVGPQQSGMIAPGQRQCGQHRQSGGSQQAASRHPSSSTAIAPPPRPEECFVSIREPAFFQRAHVDVDQVRGRLPGRERRFTLGMRRTGAPMRRDRERTMLSKTMAAAAAAMLVASPCVAAELPALNDAGARRSGAVAAAYFKVPLGGGAQARAPHAGVKLSVRHDYRHAGAQTARVVQADGLDLRLDGMRKPSLYLAGRKVDSEEARKQNLGPVGSVVTLAVLAAAAVGVYFIARAIDDSGEE